MTRGFRRRTSARWLAVALLATAACDSESEPQSSPPGPAEERGGGGAGASAEPGGEAEPPGPPPAGAIDGAWVERRVADSRSRLQASEGGELVWQAIEAHGGLERWLAQGTIEFEFDYQPVDEPGRRKHTLNRVDSWRSRAWQKELGEQADATLGWNGNEAWIVPGPDAFPAPARFWATTPYYFVGIPWVLADPGTTFTVMDDAELDGVTYRVVKVGYEQGTGDSPDDYYVIYVHPRTHHVGAIRYVVSYPGFFPDGGHSPEKLMTYLEQRQVQGLRVAHRYETFTFDVETGERGEKVTDVEISDVRFGQRWPASLFAPPEGAKVIEGIEPPPEG